MLTSMRIQNYRSFEDSGVLPLSPITLVVGRNNSGKSTLLRALYQLQAAAPWSADDIRLGASHSSFQIEFDQLPSPPFSEVVNSSKWAQPQISVQRTADSVALELGSVAQPPEIRLETISSLEPFNFIYPSLARRHGNPQYEEVVRKEQTNQIWPNENNLVARTSTVLNPRTETGREFEGFCRRVLDQTIDLMTGDNGQRLGLQVDRFRQVGLGAMGAGISATIGLLVNLTGATGKLFLIEEPENDLHPAALKSLLDIIKEKSQDNQFIISTHSSIVVTHLGASAGATVLHTELSSPSPIPTSAVRAVAGKDDRIEVLRDLGYALADLGLGDGWLIFEESSAERICRQYLIPWFAPRLGQLTTIAAAGTSRVGPLWQNLHEMNLFAHLQPASRDRVWVVVDGDKEGREAISVLSTKYKANSPDRFHAWPAQAFEKYYPAEFQERAAEVLALSHDRRRGPKKDLLRDVLTWIEVDVERARSAFESSASEAIAILRLVENQVRSPEGGLVS